MSSITSKIIATMAAILIVLFSVTGWVDEKGTEYIKEQLQVAGVAYLATTELYKKVPPEQGDEAALPPAEAGEASSAAEAINLIDEKIKQFSWVTIATLSSLGFQLILIGLASSELFDIIVVISTVVSWVLILKPQLSTSISRIVAFKICLMLIVFRFFVVSSILLTQAVYIIAIEDHQTRSIKSLIAFTERIEALTKNQSKDNQEGVSNTLKPEKNNTKASDLIEVMKDLTLSFAILTFLMPILFLWLGLKLLIYIPSNKLQIPTPPDIEPGTETDRIRHD